MKLALSDTIKKLRKDRNMTQEVVASTLKITYQSVSRWENGLSYPDVALLPEIATLFNVSMDQLFGMDPDSETAKIKEYDEEDKKIENDINKSIALAKKYISELPHCAYFKFRLLELYHSSGLEYSAKRPDEMRTLCRYAAENMSEFDYQRNLSIEYMIDVEDENNLDEWYSLLDKRSFLTSFEAERNRYEYRNEVEKYNKIIQNHLYSSLKKVFLNDFCKRDKNTYKNAKSRVDGQKIILKIIDIMRDTQVEVDAWIHDRCFALRRLAAGCFGAGQKKDGYKAMEESIDLCLAFADMPIGAVLKYNSPVLDISTMTIQKDDAPEAVHWAYDNFTALKGWEWFNGVRDE